MLHYSISGASFRHVSQFLRWCKQHHWSWFTTRKASCQKIDL